MTFVLWTTGLPSSGKTTIIRKLAEHIQNLAILDGDELREWLSPKDFSREGRNEHNRKVANLAKLLLEHNVPVGVSLISPYLENRKNAKKIIGDDKFFELYVKCSLEKCEERDVKGLYKKARKNEDFCRKGYANSTKEKFVSGEEILSDEIKIAIRKACSQAQLQLQDVVALLQTDEMYVHVFFVKYRHVLMLSLPVQLLVAQREK